MRIKQSIHGSVLLVSALLAACGGGGGSGGSSGTTYTIGGTVSGLLASTTLVLQNNGGDNRTVLLNGSFTFTTSLANAAAYNVTVLTQPAGQNCSVTGGTGTVASANVTSVSLVCKPKHELVSRSGNDAVLAGYVSTWAPALTSDARYVVFTSGANLATGASNGQRHVFVRDRQTDTTTLVSKASDGAQANGDSYAPSISSNGRYVVFESVASNLVAGDTNALSDIFLHDLQTQTTTRLSVGPAGLQADGASWRPVISGDGLYVAFDSWATNLTATALGNGNVYRRDIAGASNTLVSAATGGGGGNGVSSSASISADGSRIAFWSYASDLVVGDAGGLWDIFVWDANATPKTRLITKSTGGTQKDQGADSASRVVQPTISADGSRVAYSTTATNLVADDSNGLQDVFVHVLGTGVTTRVSTGTGNVQATGDSPVGQGERIAVSSDGAWIAFSTAATNIAGIGTGTQNLLLRNTTTDAAIALTASTGFNGVGGPAISGDGRYIGFVSSNQLDPRFASSGVFVRDRTVP